MKYLFIIMMVLMISSCETNWGKYGGYKMEYDSALDYYIIIDKGEEIYANDSKEEQLKKGTLVRYYSASGAVDSVLLGKGSTVIESFIDHDNVSYDSDFIILKQKPLKDICECNDSCLKNRYPNMNDLPTYKMCKEALEKSVFYQYWIINKRKDAVYGPFQKQEYLQKREELGIPKELKLKEE
jgi:hypothetical protein